MPTKYRHCNRKHLTHHLPVFMAVLSIFVLSSVLVTGCAGRSEFDATRAIRISEIAAYGALDIAQVQGADRDRVEQVREMARQLFERMNTILRDLDTSPIPLQTGSPASGLPFLPVVGTAASTSEGSE